MSSPFSRCCPPWFREVPTLGSRISAELTQLFEIANLRARFHELVIPESDLGSSMTPGNIDPTQCKALTMIVANDVAVGFVAP
jgi:fumarate hydratase class II